MYHLCMNDMLEQILKTKTICSLSQESLASRQRFSPQI